MPNKRVKRIVDYPQVSVTVTPNDTDLPAVFMDMQKQLLVEIPDEVASVVSRMCLERQAGRMSITVTIAGYVK